MKNNVLEQYYTAFNATNHLYSVWAKHRGLTYHTLFTLYAIFYSGAKGCCQQEICEEWMIPKQTVHSVLKTLEQEGYLHYRVNPEDRRNKIITLTEAGLRYAQPILQELGRLEETVLSKMGEELTRQMLDSTRAFCEKLKETLSEES